MSPGAHRRHRVLQITDLPGAVFLLRLERRGLVFEPGQYLTLGIPGRPSRRQYTVCSASGADFLELLIKEIPGGDLSPRLHRCKPGEMLEVTGPAGTFTIPEERRRRRLLFVATGTGIAPFHCFVTSYPGLRYQVLHGARGPGQLFVRASFDPARHVSCLTRSDNGRFHGRVTDYLRQTSVSPSTYVYLCGGTGMIFEAAEILRRHGIRRDDVAAEIYF